MEYTERELTELVPDLEFGLEVGESTAERLSVTGRPYVTLTSGGIKDEGEMVPAIYATEDRAIAAFRYEFREYAGLGKKLYWRRLPRINVWALNVENAFGGYNMHWYYVDCRVLIEI